MNKKRLTFTFFAIFLLLASFSIVLAQDEAGTTGGRDDTSGDEPKKPIEDPNWVINIAQFLKLGYDECGVNKTQCITWEMLIMSLAIMFMLFAVVFLFSSECWFYYACIIC